MRNFLLIILVFNIYAFGSIPKNNYVIPVQEKVGIYENRIRTLHERALFHVNLESRLRVLEEKNIYYRIKDEQGRTGWVEKRFVAAVRKTNLNSFNPADVKGYDDIRSFISIIDGQELTDVMIKLDRSFKENLREAVDREMVERIVQ